MADSTQVPGYDAARRAERASPGAYSGERESGDPTNEPGQYPVGGWGNAIFGGPLPEGTGAPGSGGGQGAGDDPTVEAGQLSDDFTGLSDSDIEDTGAPGTAGARHSSGAGPDAVTFTRPGSYLSGSYTEDTVRDRVDGPANWTEANDSGYAADGPKLPGMHEPTPDGGPYQPKSGGRVLRGGRDVRG
jgi:hypothetical protein